jgi:hypothetical protein
MIAIQGADGTMLCVLTPGHEQRRSSYDRERFLPVLFIFYIIIFLMLASFYCGETDEEIKRRQPNTAAMRARQDKESEGVYLLGAMRVGGGDEASEQVARRYFRKYGGVDSEAEYMRALKKEKKRSRRGNAGAPPSRKLEFREDTPAQHQTVYPSLGRTAAMAAGHGQDASDDEVMIIVRGDQKLNRNAPLVRGRQLPSEEVPSTVPQQGTTQFVQGQEVFVQGQEVTPQLQ